MGNWGNEVLTKISMKQVRPPAVSGMAWGMGLKMGVKSLVEEASPKIVVTVGLHVIATHLNVGEIS